MTKKEFKKIMGSELKIIRLENDDDQLELSRKCGVATSTISKYENGIGKIYVDKIEEIISTYNISLPVFFKRILAKSQKE